MRQGFFKKLTAAACALTLSLTLQPGALAAGTSVSTKNINKQDYTTYGSTVTSYLYENGQGGDTPVEYTRGTVILQDYPGATNRTRSRSLVFMSSLSGPRKSSGIKCFDFALVITFVIVI